MKKFFVLGFCLITAGHILAQQNPLRQQYLLDSYYLNPAFAGSQAYTSVRLTNSRYFTGIDGAPQGFDFTAYTRVFQGRNKGIFRKPGHGIGVSIFSQNKGPLKFTGAQVSYAYHVPVNKQYQFAIGAAVSGGSLHIDYNSLNTTNLGDQALVEGIDDTFVPDVDFGVYYYKHEGGLALGLTAAQLVRPLVKLDKNDTTGISNGMGRTLYPRFSFYMLRFDNVIIEPGVTAVYELGEGGDKNVHIDVKAHITSMIKRYTNEDVVLGISYRPNDGYITSISFLMDKFYLGYAYKYSLNDMASVANSNHQITLGFNFSKYAF